MLFRSLTPVRFTKEIRHRRLLDPVSQTSESAGMRQVKGRNGLFCNRLIGSLQFLDRPSQIIDRVITLNARYVLIDRFPLFALNKDRLTVQSVQAASYESSYPAWFFSEKLWLELLRRDHVVRMNWIANNDRPFLEGKREAFKGLLLERADSR